MHDTHITVANIVATPTLSTWSQTYHAGKLFVVLSVAYPTEPADKNAASLGKDILDTLEQEFFTLETKDLESIKKALEVTCAKIPNEATVGFAVAVIADTVLYVFSRSQAAVLLKRDTHLVKIVASASDSIEGASGYLASGDVIVLTTHAFTTRISLAELKELLTSSVTESVEALSPKIHQSEEGAGAAAMFVSYEAAQQKQTMLDEEPVIEQETEQEHQEEEEKEIEDEQMIATQTAPKKRLSFAPLIPLIRRGRRLVFSKKIFAVLALVLAGLLIFAIYQTLQGRQNQKDEQQAQAIIARAKEKYNEGTALLSLNKNLAREDLQAAQDIITNGKKQFKPDSKQAKELEAFDKTIQDSLQQAAAVNSVTPTQVDANASPLLSLERSDTASGYYTEDTTTIYKGDAKTVQAIAKNDKKTKELFKNDSDWKTMRGIGVFGQNIYILDTGANTIDKFTPTASGYANVSYLTDQTSVANGVSMAIDGSVYVLFKDGTITKFTKGKADTFTIEGLDTKFANATRIQTSPDIDSVYVLDNGNSRVVVLGKDGSYKAQYSADTFSKAKDIAVDEKNKKLYFLAENKIYSIDLQ